MTKNDLKTAWINEIPDDWRMVRASLTVTPVERPPLPDDEVVTCFRDGEVTLRSNRRTDGFTVSFQEIGYQHIKTGDLVIHSMDGGWGAIGVSDSDGKASPVVHAYQSEENDVKFIAYVLRAMAYSGYLIAQTKGIRERSTQFDRKSFSNLYLPLPDLDTQRRIADYLDKEIGEMDAIIEDLETLAENLKSRKVLLTESITSQDDQGNKYPTYPIGLLFRNIGSGTTPKGDEWYTESDEQGVPWVTTSELREINITDTKRYITKKAIEKVPGLRIHPAGSIMIAMYGATIGRFGRLEVPASCNQACCVLSNPYKIDPDFFYASLWAKRDELILLGSGGGQPNISQDVIKRFKMPVPPFEDQKKIAERLQVENAHMDGLIHDATTLSELLKERKTALITEVVTGRKEV